MFCFEISRGPIAWGIPIEILPSAIRAQEVALSTVSNWLNNFIVGLVVPQVMEAAPYGSFALCAGTSFLSLVWVWFFVPATWRKTIEELAGTFNDHLESQESNQQTEVRRRLLQKQLSVAASRGTTPPPTGEVKL